MLEDKPTTTQGQPTAYTNKRIDKLGTEKIGKLLLTYSAPAIVASIATALYNIIDRIFIGNGVGPMAISGLALTFPIINLATAFGTLVGVGAATMIPIKLGEKDPKTASRILGNALMLNLLIGIVFSTLGLIFIDPILYAFGATENTLPYARDFMQIILIGNIITHNYFGMNSIVRASGYPTKAMITTLITVVCNCIFAPICIFVLDWGIRGAAIATVFSQLIGVVIIFSHLLNKNSVVHFEKKNFALHLNIIKYIVSIGLAPFLLNICASVIAMFMNKGLLKYGEDIGDLQVGAYGIIISIANLFVLFILGITQGMQPIAGYNYGAKKLNRVWAVYYKATLFGVSASTLGFLTTMIFPRHLAAAFTSDSQLIEIAARGMRYVFIMFPLVGFQIVTGNFFQSIGKATIAIFLSLSRQLIFLIPILLILPHFVGLKGVWLATPIADFIASLIAFFVLLWQRKKIIKEFNLYSINK